jgi:hypothetical protein
LNTLRGARQETPAETARLRRPPAYLLVSIGVHLVLVAVLIRFVITPNAFLTVFGGPKSPPVPVERIGFLVLPKATGTPIIGRSGGDNRPATRTPPVRLTAPARIPNVLPPVAPAANAAGEEGSGPLVGTGGPARGIRPTYADPRLWPAPGDVVSAPKTATQRLDSVIADLIGPYNDSIAVAAGKRKPGDWTFERDGKKYGIDPQYIHLGKFSIPTAVLGLLPLNVQANPILAERNRTSYQLNSDIRSQAQRGMNEADFKKAVRSIRERKEREKAAAGSNGSGSGENKKQPADPPPAAQGTPNRG